jgi:hypothetical protein
MSPDAYVCPYCAVRFAVPSLTADHVRKMHPEAKP